MGYNSPGPESCRIRNSQHPLTHSPTHPYTHMQAQTNCPALHSLLTESTPNKPVCNPREMSFSLLLSDIKEHPHPPQSQLCPYFASLVLVILSNDFENWVKFALTVYDAIHCLPVKVFAIR